MIQKTQAQATAEAKPESPRLKALYERFGVLWGGGGCRTISRDQGLTYFLEGALAALELDRERSRQDLVRLAEILNRMP